jgi:hypothetical protein
MWQLEKFHPKILGAYELEPREREPYFYNVSMFSLGGSILLVSMGARHMMGDSYFVKQGFNFSYSPP